MIIQKIVLIHGKYIFDRYMKMKSLEIRALLICGYYCKVLAPTLSSFLVFKIFTSRGSRVQSSLDQLLHLQRTSEQELNLDHSNCWVFNTSFNWFFFGKLQIKSVFPQFLWDHSLGLDTRPFFKGTVCRSGPSLGCIPFIKNDQWYLLKYKPARIPQLVPTPTNN